MSEERIHRNRVVVSAANRSEKLGVVFCGVRHFDPIMHAQMDAIVKEKHGEGYTIEQWHEYLGPQEQGFVDNRYNFLTREEAMIVAKGAGQKICPRGCGGSETVLFSEGLY